MCSLTVGGAEAFPFLMAANDPVSMPADRPQVALVFTGGTVAMRHDAAAGGAVPALSGKDLVRQIPMLAELATLVPVEFDRIPGPHMTPGRVLELAQALRPLLDDPGITGIVVTHGTDTLEETAYLLDRILSPSKPLVLTGAMRTNSDPAWDGATNLTDAVRVAAHPASSGAGVLVVFDGNILSGRDATKRHTDHPSTFGPRDGTVLGSVNATGVVMDNLPMPAGPPLAPILAEPVEILTLPMGSDGRMVDLAVEAGVRGLILQGLGCGNIPLTAVPAVERALARGIPVVISTRCWQGETRDTYAYRGAGRTLVAAGAVLAGNLPAHKARLELMLRLGNQVKWGEFPVH